MTINCLVANNKVRLPNRFFTEASLRMGPLRGSHFVLDTVIILVVKIRVGATPMFYFPVHFVQPGSGIQNYGYLVLVAL